MVAISTSRRNASGGIISQRRLVCIFSAIILLMMAFYTSFLSSMLNKHQQLLLQSPTAAGSKEVVEQQEESGPPVVIAHAISLIKCGKKSSVTGFIDAAAVLRHSIHKNSIHYNSNSNNNATPNQSNKRPPSRYSYQMYAIVHTSCEEHAKSLERLGYKILVKDHPVKKEDIQGEWLRNHIEAENCCGSAEFIKLYAYHLTDHPIVVHWDMDVAILQPLAIHI